MIHFLISMLVMCVVIYVIYLVLGLLKLPEVITRIVYLIIGLVVLFWILNYFGIYHSDIGTLRTIK